VTSPPINRQRRRERARSRRSAASSARRPGRAPGRGRGAARCARQGSGTAPPLPGVLPGRRADDDAALRRERALSRRPCRM